MKKVEQDFHTTDLRVMSVTLEPGSIIDMLRQGRELYRLWRGGGRTSDKPGSDLVASISIGRTSDLVSIISIEDK